MERVAGIEPASLAWKAKVLPLNYTRNTTGSFNDQAYLLAPIAVPTAIKILVVGAGFEPAKLSRQIYSLIPLAAREPHRSGAYYMSQAHTCQQLFTYFLST